MTEISRPWEGIILGDSGPYTDDHWTDIWAEFLGALADANTGVLSNVENELEVTGGATPLSVNTGVALVDGTYYTNTAAVSIVIATPAGATRIDRVVLRKSWAAQTVRITLVAGVEGGAAPALTQVDGTTWDMPLFQASINVGGVVTLTDERERLNTRAPSMTTAQRDAMTAVNGMIIYNETLTAVQVRQNGVWATLTFPVFTELASGVHVAVGVGAFENWDVSAIVPAGTTDVLVVIEQITVANVSNGCRNNGSALNRRYNMQDNMHVMVVCPVDSARILEIYDGNAAVGANFYIAGYWA